MKPWARLFFALFSLTILTTIGVKLHELDMPVARFVRSFDIHALNQVGDFLALAGKGEVLAGLFLLIGLLGWRSKRDRLREIGIRGLLALAAVGVVSQLLKHLIGRPRPRYAHGDEFALGSSLDSGFDSFPSGHTINAFGAAAVVAWFVPALRVPAYMMAGLVGLSRVIRGSHFPTDVFVGAVLGVVIGSLAAVGYRRWGEQALPGLIRTGVPIAVSIFLVVWAMLHEMPPWSQEVWRLTAGAALVLAGLLARGGGIIELGGRRRLFRTVGGGVAILGVAAATGPWWVSCLFLIALLPRSFEAAITLAAPAHSTTDGGLRGHIPPWGQEALVASIAILGILAIRSVQGVLPIG